MFPKVKELIGPDLFASALAKMEELQLRMKISHDMLGGGPPYPTDSKLFLKALEAVLSSDAKPEEIGESCE